MNPKYPYYGSKIKCKEIPLTFPPQEQYRQPGLEYELAPVYVLLASDDGSYITGQTIHVNGGQMVTT